MVDTKVYKTDYQSDFANFFKEISDDDKVNSKAVIEEIKKYSAINRLRDTVSETNSRNKLWEGF